MTSAVCRLKALRGKPKAKHIESELLSAVVRTHHPRVVEAQLGERGRNTDFTGWPSTEGQTGSQTRETAMSQISIVGYESDCNCEHCGRALRHGIRLSDGRLVGAS